MKALGSLKHPTYIWDHQCIDYSHLLLLNDPPKYLGNQKSPWEIPDISPRDNSQQHQPNNSLPKFTMALQTGVTWHSMQDTEVCYHWATLTSQNKLTHRLFLAQEQLTKLFFTKNNTLQWQGFYSKYFLHLWFRKYKVQWKEMSLALGQRPVFFPVGPRAQGGECWQGFVQEELQEHW